jgi:uncharacterized protein (DUF305 family)
MWSGAARKEESQMKYMSRTNAALLGATELAACNSQSSNNEPAAQAPAAENASLTANDASNPFAGAEQKMSQAMMSAVGTDVGDNWAKKMIAHHQGAIDMSQVVLAQNPKPDVAMMAREAIEKQQKDIDNIRKLLKNGAPDQKSADLYRSAMMEMDQKMQAAKGPDVSETFMRKMLEHHKGAVAMSDIALANGVTGALRAQIEKTRDENRKDAAMVEAMLRGESMSHATADSGAMFAKEGSKEPAPADKASKAPDRSAHDMNDMGNMDMNHM